MNTDSFDVEVDIDNVFEVLLIANRDFVDKKDLVFCFRKAWKDLGLDEAFLLERECDINTLQLVMNLIRKSCEAKEENRKTFIPAFFEFILQNIVFSEELKDFDEVESLLKKLLEYSFSLLLQGYGEDLSWLGEVEVSLLRIAFFLFVKVLKVPEKRSKTLGNFAPEIFYICLFLCYWRSPENISWIQEQEIAKDKINISEKGPDVVDKKNSAYWTCIRCIQILGIHKRVDNVQSLVGQLWPALQPIFVKALKYEDYQRKDNILSEHPSFLSHLIKYSLSLMNVEELEGHISSILRLLVPLSQDFDRQRRLQTIESFQLLIHRCSSSVVEEHKSSFYIILRVLCRFREPGLIDTLLSCIIQFIQKIKAHSKDCFDESCTSEFYELLDAVIDLVSYCTLGSSSFAISMNELRRVVCFHLASFIQVVDKRIYARLQRLLPCICELLEKTCSSNKGIETNSFQNTAEALQFLLVISQPFIPFYLQTLIGSILTCISTAKTFMNIEGYDIVSIKCIELLDIVRVNSEPSIFWNCINESEEIGKEPPGVDGVTEWIVQYRRHVVNSKHHFGSLEKLHLDTFDDLFENSSNPFKLFLQISL
ncbi:hypothetical protein Gasu2_05470 [Galdieria sulphuraria]|uniref:Uncharacterized protein n=1 Tax=Galdieria sulphuraria TaxID=130081 RepID=M2Y969_GALSU|nr:uncharacterized protein Gasu_04770 [Galdieria sulphuraria]EME32389.1 hypothetical protein Gasu_04770 [Galdieria sulphuraria]GJD06115.1 hypothetical protein Gasu2_05470 [Galdieria sulphuraria]|eukprot:XP_005708909.1 hypothetical protein Gasu_04770 [Galdieria sulphuraria]